MSINTSYILRFSKLVICFSLLTSVGSALSAVGDGGVVNAPDYGQGGTVPMPDGNVSNGLVPESQLGESYRVECDYVIVPGAPRRDVEGCGQPEREPSEDTGGTSCLPSSWTEIRSGNASGAMSTCTSRTRQNCPSWNSAWIQDACVALVREFCAHTVIGSTDGQGAPGCNQGPYAIAAEPLPPPPPPPPPPPEPGGTDEGNGMGLPPIPPPRPDSDDDPQTPTAESEAEDTAGNGSPGEQAGEGEDDGQGGEQAGTNSSGDPNDPNNPGGYGGSPSQATRQGAERLAQICLDTFAEANQCCNSPLSCMGVDQSSQNDLAGLAGVGGAAAANTQSIQQACEMMRVAGYSSTGINGAGAYMCSESKNSCLDTCEASKAEIVRMIQVECGYNPDQTTGSCPGVQSAYDLVASRQISCTSFSANVAAMGKQAAHSHSSTQMAALCAEQSRTQLSGTGYENPVQDYSAIDCTDPSNQYDARCRDCSNPTMANSALCKTGSGGSNYQQGVSQAGKTNAPMDMSSKSDFGSRPSGGSGYGAGSAGENSPQQAQFGGGMGQQQAASSKGVPNNGGSFVGGGSGAAGFGGGGGSKSAGSARGGYNTDVLGGFRGGSGYSNPVGANNRARQQRPGFRVPAQASANQKQGTRFDLKKFLPGGSQDPNHRLAGMAGTASSEIGPSHADIWLRMSNRVREICKLNRLYDCGRRK